MKKGTRCLAMVLVVALLMSVIAPGQVAEAASPGKPGKVKVTSVKAKNASTIQVKWKKASKAKGYQILVSTNKKFKKSKKTVTTTKKSKAVENLKENKTYYVKVRAYSKKGKKKVYGSWSKVKKAKTPKVPTPAQSSITTWTAESESAIQIAWRTVANTGGYQVSIARNAAFTSGAATYSVTGTAMRFPNLSENTRYYFRVRAVNKSGTILKYGNWSGTVYTSTKEIVKEPEEVLEKSVVKSSEAKSDSEILLAWDEVSGAEGYEIEAAKDENFAEGTTTYYSAGTSYTVGGLTENTSYYFRIRAYKTVNGKKQYGEWSETVNLMTVEKEDPTPPEKATPPEVAVVKGTNAVSTSEIQVQWDKVADAKGYEVEAAKDNKFTAGVISCDSAATSCTVKGLEEDTQYYFRVRAYKMADGEKLYGEWSQIVSERTKKAEIALPGTVTVNETKALSTSEIRLSWDSVSDANGYEVEAARDDGFTVDPVSYEITGKEYTFQSLAPNTQYYFRVRAYKTVGGEKYYGAWSQTVHATTEEEAPLPPAAVVISKAEAVSDSEVELAWNETADAEGYEVEIAEDDSFTQSKESYQQAGLSREFTGLKENTTYYFRVRAYKMFHDSKIYGDWSEIKPVQTQEKLKVPAVPDGSEILTAESHSTTSVDLTWEKVQGVSGYELMAAKDQNFSDSAKTYKVNTESYSVPGLEPDTTYYFRVRTYNTENGMTEWSAWSSVKEARTKKPEVQAPGKGEISFAQSTSPTEASVSWSEIENVDGYELAVAKDDGFTSELQSFRQTGTSMTVSGLKEDTAYYVRVRAYRKDGESFKYGEWSDTRTFTTQKKPEEVPTPDPSMILTADGISPSEVALTWQEVPDVTGYVVAMAKDSEFSNGVKTFRKTETSMNVGDLEAETEYYFRVRTYKTVNGSTKYSAWSDAKTATTQKKPEEITPPGMVTVTSAVPTSTTEIDLSWKQVEDASGYEVSYSTDPDFQTDEKKMDETGTSLHLANLQEDTKYYIRVRAYKTVDAGMKYGVWSQVSEVTTQKPEPKLEAPGKVTGMSASAVSYSEIEATWNGIEGVSGYELECSKDPAFSDAEPYVQAGTSYTVRDLDEDTEYYFRVRAYNASGDEKKQGEWSETASASTQKKPEEVVAPDSTSILSALASSTSEIDVTWRESSEATGYELAVAKDESFSSDAKSYSISGTSYHITDLDEDTVYYIKVRAYKRAGDIIKNSEWSSTANARTQKAKEPEKEVLPPAKAELLSAEGKSTSEILVSWNEVEGADGYELMSAKDDGFTDGAETYTQGGTSYTVSGLEENTQYYFRVRAYKLKGAEKVHGDWSESKDAMTFEKVLPPAKTQISAATPLSETQIQVTWDVSDDATGYELMMAKDVSFEDHAVTVQQDDTEYLAEELDPDTTYYFKIRAYKTAHGITEYSEWSEPANATTKPVVTAPGKATLNPASPVSDTEILVSWELSGEADGYELEVARDPDFEDIVKNYTQEDTSVNVDGLDMGTVYYFRVHAYNMKESDKLYGEWSDTQSARTNIVLVAPEAVSLTEATPVSASEIRVSWGTAEDATGYELEVGKDGEFLETAGTYTETGTEYTVTGLEKNTEYYFRVRAFVSQEEVTEYSAWSDAMNAMTEDVTAPEKGEILTAEVASHTEVLVTWNEIPEADGYQVEVSEDETFQEGVSDYDTEELQYTVNGLKEYTTYYFRIRGYCKSGSYTEYGEWSEAKDAKTTHDHVWTDVTETRTNQTYEMVPFDQAENLPSANNKYRCMCEECKQGDVAYQQSEVLDLMKEHMEEVNSPGWYEEIWSSHQICGKCGLDLTAAGMTVNEMGMHQLECRASRYSDMRVDRTVEHLSKTVGQQTTVVTGQRCDICGEMQ